MYQLGNKVRDVITGFEGIATGHCRYMYGCNQVLITPDRLGSDGKTLNGEWFDDQRVEVIEERVIPVSATATAIAGGPQRDAPPTR